MRLGVRVTLLLVGLPALAAVGYVIPRHLIPNGLAAYQGDPVAYEAASNAYDGVWMLNNNPWGRLLLPGAQVRRVWREPGHCRDPRPEGPVGEYRAEVRTFTWFGIPGPVMHSQCGGWYWSWTR